MWYNAMQSRNCGSQALLNNKLMWYNIRVVIKQYKNKFSHMNLFVCCAKFASAAKGLQTMERYRYLYGQDSGADSLL